MSVYARKRKDGKTAWLYDFVLKGRRFLSPSGGFETRRKAEQAEAARRQRVIDGRDHEDEDLTLDQAAGVWWRDKGSRLGDAKMSESRVARLVALIGPNMRLADIRTRTVNEAIQRRRRGLVRGRPPSDSTINRDIIGTLRPILRYAAGLYELSLPAIAWDDLRLAEPPPEASHREFSEAEIEAWAGQLAPLEQFFLGMALTYGPRFGELFFPLDAFGRDAEGQPTLLLGRYKGRHGWKHRRKDGSLLPLPIAEADLDVITMLAAVAEAAGAETVWVEPKGDGVFSEIPYWGMHHRLRRGAAKAGIAPGRLIHGMRHHAGSQILRATRDIMMAKRLLGHRDVGTTQRYAQVSTADLRGGLARVSRQVPAPISHASAKQPKKQEDGDA